MQLSLAHELAASSTRFIFGAGAREDDHAFAMYDAEHSIYVYPPSIDHDDYRVSIWRDIDNTFSCHDNLASAMIHIENNLLAWRAGA